MIKHRAIKWPLLIALGFGFIIIFDLFIRLAVPIGSNDLWWHIVLGQQVIDTGSIIPDHSIFTWTPATAYHAYSSWLSDVILYYIHEKAGIAGLLLLRYVIFFSVFILVIYFAIKRRIGRHPLTWVIILIGLNLVGSSTLIRPELFSLGFMGLVVWLYYHLRAIGDAGWRLAYLFPIIMIVWVNVHGAFFLSALFFLSTIVGELLNLRFAAGQSMPSRLRKHYLIAMLLCFFAILVNPYGIELPLGILNSVINQSAEDYVKIIAYQPTYTLNKAPYYILDYLMLAMILFVLLLWQKINKSQTDWVAIVSFVVFCALFIQVIRTTYFLAPVFIFSSLDLLSVKKESVFWPRNIVAKYAITVISVAIVSIMSWRLVQQYNGMVTTGPIAWFDRIRVVGDRFPQVEADYIAAHMEGQRIGNLYGDGGYLMYRLWPEKKVMIDPRYFPFKAWISDYVKFDAEGVGIQEFVNSKNADFWLINYSNLKSLTWFSKSDEWSLAFVGPVAAIFVPTSEFSDKTTYSMQIRGLSSLSQISKILGVAAIFEDITLIKELRKIAVNNIEKDIKYKEQFLDDVDSLLSGLIALSNKRYESAAELLASSESITYSITLSAKVYRYMASMAWQEGDYLVARKWSVAAYNVLPNKILPDIYNIALTDWHVRHMVNGGVDLLSDQVRWEDYADLLISSSTLIDEDQQSIVDTAVAMKNGSYNGQASLFHLLVF